MKLLIDDANIEVIKRLYEFYPVDGVTCNPSILNKVGKDPYLALKEIRKFIGEDAQLHVQVISSKAEGMVEEAYTITQELGKQTYIKVPAIREGIKAIKRLRQEGFNVTATAIYTPLQGYLAAKAGANYLAPYVNRMDNLGYSGVDATIQLDTMIKNANLNCEVLAASFKNEYQVHQLCVAGIGAATINDTIFDSILQSDTLIQATKVFVNDFEQLCGPNQTMKR